MLRPGFDSATGVCAVLAWAVRRDGGSRRGGGSGPGRRHRRGHRRDDRARPAAPLIPEASRLAATAPASEPLGPAEVAEMRQHLAFLRRWREALRIKLNAAEDLLVNGQREPTDRGVCRHLLGKLDRAVLDAAISREPLRSDAAARARMLAGALRVTADDGVLLSYLEALAHVRVREEAAAAFAEAVGRLDFEALSPTRLARLLQVLLDTFAGHERVQVLFGLLGLPAFRRAFDAAAATFTGAVREAFGPLHALQARVGAGEDVGPPPALALAGLEQVLAAPDPAVRAYDEGLRTAMLEVALDPAVPPALADRAASVLLPSLARAGRAHGRLALRRAAQLLARHADDRARAVLDELRCAQPGSRTADRWVAALDARRLGRVALDADVPAAGRLAPGFWLDGQRPVWVRTASADAAARLAGEAALHAVLAVPSVAVVVEQGVAHGSPYVAVAAPGRPLAAEPPSGPRAALALAAAMARLLGAVALAGVVLPDADPGRFLHDAPAGPTLADLDGARRVPAEEATAAHARLAAAFATRALAGGALVRLPLEVAHAVERALAAPGDLATIVAALDRAALHAPPQGGTR
ncbi:MAG: hypothetical protein U0807_12000 [Candidatus Binatia bacterium]